VRAMLEQPQRHRDTEKTQSHPPGVCPQITQIHRNDPIKKRRGAETQRRRGEPRQIDRPESADLASHVDQNLAFEQARLRRDRRAASASAGGKSDRDGCLHPERSGFSPGAGDLRIAGVAAASLQVTSPTPVSRPLHLCASAPLRFLSVASLCVSVPLWFVRYHGSSKTLQPWT
jgi:hypothetical protein